MLTATLLGVACQGERGPVGPIGVQGSPGVSGVPGPQGIAGPQGDPGIQGEPGIAGPQGERGETGPQGERGETGSQGERGETGVQGEQGERGETGPQGEQGEQGPVGPQGEQGEQGLVGPQGQTLNWADVIEDGNLYDAVYAVGIMMDDGNITVGTAFGAYYTDRLWTNAHVVTRIDELMDDDRLRFRNPRPFVAKTGTLIGGNETYAWNRHYTHPDYDGTVESPDLAILVLNEGLPQDLPSLLPREMTGEMRIGQPLGTLGFPAYPPLHNDVLPLATFREGTLSSLRPFYDAAFDRDPQNTGRVVHYNMSLAGGTSGSPVFDHNGYIVAVNYAGIVREILDDEEVIGGVETHEDYGIHVLAVWEFIDWLESADGTATIAESRSVGYGWIAGLQLAPDGLYQPFPSDWNGEIVIP